MILDLFSGAGGWDHAARSLGMDPVGIELGVAWDPVGGWPQDAKVGSVAAKTAVEVTDGMG